VSAIHNVCMLLPEECVFAGQDVATLLPQQTQCSMVLLTCWLSQVGVNYLLQAHCFS